MKDLLPALYATRNSFVHAGYFPNEGGLDEVNQLKFVVERAINVIFSWLDELPTTNSLKYFYDHASQNNIELENRSRVIARIQNRRAKSKSRRR